MEELSMETAKDEVRRMLDTLPDESTFEDIQYRLYVRQAIDVGLRDLSEGRTLSQEEVEQRVARWIER
jgi:predicted transcriptional regulator